MGKILILDDEEDIGIAISDALEYGGYDAPEIVTGAEEALTKIRSGNISLAVIDARLSGRVSGVDVIRACREIPNRPRILAMSGITKSSLTQILEDERVMDLVERVLEKPVDILPGSFLPLLKTLGI